MNEEMTWILQVQRGDDDGFTNLVETYQKPVYNLCYRMLGEPEAAEDAAQETFLKAYQNFNRYDPQRSFATWLLSIAAHHCIDRLRRKKFVSFSIDQDEEEPIEIADAAAPDPEREMVHKQERQQVQRMLDHLEPLDRAAIVLRYWHDASEVEIARTLKLTVPAVKSRLHRARRALAAGCQDEGSKRGLERKKHESPAF